MGPDPGWIITVGPDPQNGMVTTGHNNYVKLFAQPFVQINDTKIANLRPRIAYVRQTSLQKQISA